MSDDDTAEHAEPATVGSFATQGEAEVAQAKLSGYGIESAVVDVLEGGAIPGEGENGLALQVRARDASDAAAILTEPTPELRVQPPEIEP
jgi:hypothetical protein